MKALFIFSLLLSGIGLFLTGCQTGHCRRDGTQVEIKDDVKPPSGYNRDHFGRSLVAKADGSLHCSSQAGVGLQEMGRQLGKIEVYGSSKKHDGLTRIQACGTETGIMNVYEIPTHDLMKAKRAGFQVFRNTGP